MVTNDSLKLSKVSDSRFECNQPDLRSFFFGGFIEESLIVWLSKAKRPGFPTVLLGLSACLDLRRDKMRALSRITICRNKSSLTSTLHFIKILDQRIPRSLNQYSHTPQRCLLKRVRNTLEICNT